MLRSFLSIAAVVIICGLPDLVLSESGSKMEDTRLVQKDQARENAVGETVVMEYFTRAQVPNVGLATAVIKGAHPPEDKGSWAVNKRVDEIFYVIDGTATIVYKDGVAFEVGKQSAVYLPLGKKYRIEDAKDLRIVIATGPAWFPDQHEWSSD